MIGQFIEKAKPLFNNIKTGTGSVLIKHSNIIEQLTLIRSIAETSGLKIAEIKLRENTLEDVFIHLTGRNLRQ